MLRYMRQLEAKDLSLTHSMIPLGSCTMKLNAHGRDDAHHLARVEAHPPVRAGRAGPGLSPDVQRSRGMLSEITGFSAASLQPNAGSQGEYAGLLAIRDYHESRGQGDRDVCLIPSSAHGTNPASAVMAGYRVVVVACDDSGNVDLGDLETKAAPAPRQAGGPDGHLPVDPRRVRGGDPRISAIVHEHGGQVYMDGANMNAQVGLCRPGDFGADVCHLNLHKTFCIPHGGGGPGMGPIGVAAHLAPFLPRHPLNSDGAAGAVSAAPWGSASILLISWTYIRLMGAEGLTRATKVAILNANYIAQRLAPHYPVFYKGNRGRVAHECIVDVRGLKKLAGIEVEDVAKRLMDYGFHAPTMSFPIPGTLMIEPTESEAKAELDRFCDAMIAIREEIADIERGEAPREDNVLKNAPHTAAALLAAEWPHPYARERAAFPLPFARPQVLAARRAPQQRAWRPQALLHLPADRDLRLDVLERDGALDIHRAAARWRESPLAHRGLGAADDVLIGQRRREDIARARLPGRLDGPPQHQRLGRDLRRRHLARARDFDPAVLDLGQVRGQLAVQQHRVDRAGGRARRRRGGKTGGHRLNGFFRLTRPCHRPRGQRLGRRGRLGHHADPARLAQRRSGHQAGRRHRIKHRGGRL